MSSLASKFRRVFSRLPSVNSIEIVNERNIGVMWQRSRDALLQPEKYCDSLQLDCTGKAPLRRHGNEMATLFERLLKEIHDDDLERPTEEVVAVLDAICANLSKQDVNKCIIFARRHSGSGESLSALSMIFSIQFGCDRGKQLLPGIVRLIHVLQPIVEASNVTDLLRRMLWRRSIGPEILPLITLLRTAGALPNQIAPLDSNFRRFYPNAGAWNRIVFDEIDQMRQTGIGSVLTYTSAWHQFTYYANFSCRSLLLLLEWLRWELTSCPTSVQKLVVRAKGDIDSAGAAARRSPFHLPTQLYWSLMQKIAEAEATCGVTSSESPIEISPAFIMALTEFDASSGIPATSIEFMTSVSSSTLNFGCLRTLPKAMMMIHPSSSSSSPTTSNSHNHINPIVTANLSLVQWISEAIEQWPPRMKSAELIDLLTRPQPFDPILLTKQRKLVDILLTYAREDVQIDLATSSCENVSRSLLEFILVLPTDLLSELAPIELQLVSWMRSSNSTLSACSFQSLLKMVEQVTPIEPTDLGWLLYKEIIQSQLSTGILQQQRSTTDVASSSTSSSASDSSSFSSVYNSSVQTSPMTSHARLSDELQVSKLFQLLGCGMTTLQSCEYAQTIALLEDFDAPLKATPPSRIRTIVVTGQEIALTNTSAPRPRVVRPNQQAKTKPIGVMKRDLMVFNQIRAHLGKGHKCEREFFNQLICPIVSSSARLKEYFELAGDSGTDRLWPDSLPFGLLVEMKGVLKSHEERRRLSPRVCDTSNDLCQLLMAEQQRFMRNHLSIIKLELGESLIPDLMDIVFQYLIYNEAELPMFSGVFSPHSS